jgi:hypothetical protein
MFFKCSSDAWNEFNDKVQEILSKIHTHDCRGNPTHEDDTTFKDAVSRLCSLKIIIGSTEFKPLSEYLATMLVYDELEARQDQEDRESALVDSKLN